MSDRMVKITEEQYERTFLRWEYTPKWRFIARWSRKKEWELWLDALSAEVRRDYESFH